MRKLLTGMTALALTALSVAASAAPAAPSVANPASALSISPSVRSGTRTAKSSKLGGASAIPIVIGAAIAAGVAYLVVDHEDKNSPDSN